MNLALLGVGLVGFGGVLAVGLVALRLRTTSPAPAPAGSSAGKRRPVQVGGDEDVTLFSVPPPEGPPSDAFDESIPHFEAAAVPLFADPEAEIDEPTAEVSLLLVSAAARSDPGKKRALNEDSLLEMPEKSLFAVADGMGGHAGGEVASRLAVDALASAYRAGKFEGKSYPELPRRAGELAQAIQEANRQIWDRARAEEKLTGMGTTVVATLFTLQKHRVYIGHVGDSRCYRLRGDTLKQLTADHTLGALGLEGRFADRLSRAVGVEPAVTIDLVTAEIHPGDTYVLCSDGLSKMASDQEIGEILLASPSPDDAVKRLVDRANSRGGNDNITVIVVRVEQLGIVP